MPPRRRRASLSGCGGGLHRYASCPENNQARSRAGHRRRAPVASRERRSETEFSADLQPAWVTNGALRLAEACVTYGGVQVVVAAEVLPVEDVEQIGGHAYGATAKLGEVLPQTEIDVLEHWAIEAAWNEPALGRIERVVEAVAHIQLHAAAEGHQSTELDAVRERQVHDPIGHQMMAFVVPDLARVVYRVGEAEVVIVALGLALGERVGQACSPAPPAGLGAAVGAINLHL